MKILVIEDDLDIQAILKIVLIELGKAEVVSADMGKEAPALAQQEKPDLILLDVMLPDTNGLDVCQKLKSDPELADIPVIFLSAYSMTSEVQRGLSLGAIGYLAKPFDPSELIQRINDLLKPLGKSLGKN